MGVDTFFPGCRRVEVVLREHSHFCFGTIICVEKLLKKVDKLLGDFTFLICSSISVIYSFGVCHGWFSISQLVERRINSQFYSSFNFTQGKGNTNYTILHIILYKTYNLFYLYYSCYHLLQYACPVEIGKELAISHAPPEWSVDVQCSIALLFIYSHLFRHAFFVNFNNSFCRRCVYRRRKPSRSDGRESELQATSQEHQLYNSVLPQTGEYECVVSWIGGCGDPNWNVGPFFWRGGVPERAILYSA